MHIILVAGPEAYIAFSHSFLLSMVGSIYFLLAEYCTRLFDTRDVFASVITSLFVSGGIL